MILEITNQDPPLPLINFLAPPTNITTTSVDLRWTLPLEINYDSFTHFGVFVRLLPYGEWQRKGNRDKNRERYDSNYFFQVTGLEAGKSYSFKVEILARDPYNNIIIIAISNEVLVVTLTG